VLIINDEAKETRFHRINQHNYDQRRKKRILLGPENKVYFDNVIDMIQEINLENQ